MEEEGLQDNDRDLLEKLRLYEGNYLKRAAALLFHSNPERYITGASIKIGYFKNDADLIFQDEIHNTDMTAPVYGRFLSLIKLPKGLPKS